MHQSQGEVQHELLTAANFFDVYEICGLNPLRKMGERIDFGPKMFPLASSGTWYTSFINMGGVLFL